MPWNRLPEPLSGVRPQNRLWEPITSSVYFANQSGNVGGLQAGRPKHLRTLPETDRPETGSGSHFQGLRHYLLFYGDPMQKKTLTRKR